MNLFLRSLRVPCGAFIVFFFASPGTASDWLQFRGTNANGIAVNDSPLPAEIGPKKNVLWKIALASGHSSPVIHNGRIYLTALDNKKLLTFGLDANSGSVLWAAEANYEKLESVHRIGSPATSTVVTDGKHVFSFFGSVGLFCYDLEGQSIWSRKLGPFNNQFGATSSPVLHEDRIVMVQDHDTGSYVFAVDKRTGKTIWKTDRPNFRRNYGSPTIWTVNGKPQVVVAGSAYITGYDLESGKHVWTVRGICRVVSTTPVVGNDGLLYVAATGGGKPTAQPSFKKLISTADANGNKLLEESELPKSQIRSFLYQFDTDLDKSLNEAEYETIREIFDISQTAAFAIKPGGTGDITESHVLWTQTKSIPRNSTLLIHQGTVFMVKDGGILATLNAKTGDIIKQGRLAGRGSYYSSAVVGDGKVYLISERGDLTVVSAKGEWEQLSETSFGEDTLATPAIVDGKIYLRTVKSLYCFGLKTK